MTGSEAQKSTSSEYKASVHCSDKHKVSYCSVRISFLLRDGARKSERAEQNLMLDHYLV